MLRPLSRRLFAFALTAMLLGLAAPAQDYKPLLGSWNMSSETNDDPVKWTLVLKEDAGKLTGTTSTPDGETPAKDLTYADGVLKFKTPYQSTDYEIELKQDAGKLVGTWSGGGDSGRTTGTKAEKVD